MKRAWRDRGFVEDSDGDDDEDDSDDSGLDNANLPVNSGADEQSASSSARHQHPAPGSISGVKDDWSRTSKQKATPSHSRDTGRTLRILIEAKSPAARPLSYKSPQKSATGVGDIFDVPSSPLSELESSSEVAESLRMKHTAVQRQRYSQGNQRKQPQVGRVNNQNDAGPTLQETPQTEKLSGPAQPETALLFPRPDGLSRASSQTSSSSLLSEPPTTQSSVAENNATHSTPLTEPRVAQPIEDQEWATTPAGQNHGRNFRARNPVQLHPYEYDRQQYHRTLNGTGYRPVRVTDHSPRRLPHPVEIHPDGHESDTSASAGELLIPSSPSSVGFGADFPDLSPVDRESFSDVARNGYKRQRLNGPDLHDGLAEVVPPPARDRKVQRVRSKFIKRQFRIPTGLAALAPVGLMNDADAATTGFDDSEDGFFSGLSGVEMLTRSPATASKALALDSSGSESDEGPISTRRNGRLTALTINDGRNEDLESEGRRDSTNKAATPTPGPPAIQSEDLQRARKKIKGVLPASWLRMDQAQKETRASKKPVPRPFTGRVQSLDRRSGEDPSSPHVISAGRNLETSIKTLHDSSAEDTDNTPSIASSGISRFRVPAGLNRVAAPAGAHETQDVQEVDWIDDMRAPKTRIRPRKSSSKRQTRLDLEHGLERYPNRTSNELSARQRGQKSSNSHKTRTARHRQQSSKPPRLSIIDVIDNSPSKSLPDFVRIASRRAKARPDRGRHSPRQKHLSFHNREEGLEADLVLREWRSAKSRPSEKYPPRPPVVSSEDPKSRPQTTRPQGAMLNKGPRTNNSEPAKSHIDLEHAQSEAYQEVRKNQSKLPYTQLLEDKENREPPRQQGSKASTQPRSTKRLDTVKQIFSRPADYVRPGILEELQSSHDRLHRRSAFHKELWKIRRSDAARSKTLSAENLLLERFLRDDSSEQIAEPQTEGQVWTDDRSDKHVSDRRSAPSTPKTRLKKRPPRQLQIEVDERPHFIAEEEDKDLLTGSEDPFNLSSPNAQASRSETIEGLLPPEIPYSIDFGISPLPVGLCFHESTFIGSGELLQACSLSQRELLMPQEPARLNVYGKIYHLGAWTQETSSDLRAVFTTIQDSLHSSVNLEVSEMPLSQISSILRALVSWISNKLYFVDEIDIQSCSTFLTSSVQSIVPQADSISAQQKGSHYASLIWLYLTSFSAQLLQLVNGKPDLSSVRKQCEALLMDCLRRAVNFLVNSKRQSILQFYDRWKACGIYDSSIRDASTIECLVSVMVLSSKFNRSSTEFWSILQEALLSSFDISSRNVDNQERAWQTLFAALPLCEFDMEGVQKKNKRLEHPSTDWTVANASLTRVFELYASASNATSSNAYLRTLLSRCFKLIKVWSWYKWETTLKKIYDFFAQRGFFLLNSEAGQTRTSFLETLDKEQEPILEPADRSFQIFLKTLAVGLLRLRRISTDKKVLNITWRFIPNHGRTHRKEESLRQEDLDAIRNQHELLCVLYYASPPAARPKIQLIRGLADFRLSHIEICRLNIRAWANLTRFQLSTDEPSDAINPFVTWLNDALEELVALHKGARTEADSFLVNSVTPYGSKAYDSIVRGNQRQVEALINTILNCLAEILKTAKNDTTTQHLYYNTRLDKIFELYRTSPSQLSSSMLECLGVYQAYASRHAGTTRTFTLQQASEESQDYGDFPALDDIDLDEPEGNPKNCPSVQQDKPLAYLHGFLSNCLGSEREENDSILERVIDSYVQVLRNQVKSGQQDWSDVLDEHGQRSWSSFPSTEMTSKYEVLFVASVVRCDTAALKENSTRVLSVWLTSLVQRESLLKYQHVLTSTLLNAWPEHQLLWNLPFSDKNDLQNRKRVYDISLEELRQSRLSLLSSVLANMQASYLSLGDASRDVNKDQNSTDVSAQLLRDFQAKLKWNYEQTMSGTSTRGAYITFVQQVVTLLQQYATDICPVDRFFTDGSNAFPLPEDDPTYLVGRLKAYGPKLADGRTQKQLAAFVLNAFTRAAADNQSEYLVDQIKRSISGQFETMEVLTLRRLLVQTIFPVYLKAAMDTLCGWIVALPVFDILSTVFKSLFQLVDLASERGIRPALEMLGANLSILASKLPGAFQQAQESTTLTRGDSRLASVVLGIYRVAIASLPCIGYFQRLAPLATAEPLLQAIRLLRDHASELRKSGTLAATASRPSSLDLAASDMDNRAHAALAQYTTDDLRQTLTREWSCHTITDDAGQRQRRYYVLRGRGQREVRVPSLATDSVDGGSVDDDRAGDGNAAQPLRRELVAALDAFEAGIEQAGLLPYMTSVSSASASSSSSGAPERALALRPQPAQRGRRPFACADVYV